MRPISLPSGLKAAVRSVVSSVSINSSKPGGKMKALSSESRERFYLTPRSTLLLNMMLNMAELSLLLGQRYLPCGGGQTRNTRSSRTYQASQRQR